MRLRLSILLVCLAATAAWGQTPQDGGHGVEPPAAASPNKPRRSPPSAPGSTPPQHVAPAAVPACDKGREIAIDPAAGPLHLGLKTYPQTLKLNDHEVVLTFDDGPARDSTPQILDTLKEACVHATFFLIGRHAAEHPQLARREMEDGHSVGHHSQTHPSFTLRGFDTASAKHDIAAGIASDERTIYGDAATPEHPHVPFFRFPGFADSPAMLAFLDKREIAVFGTDLWAADWLEMTPEHERERVMTLLEKAPHHNGILLFHDTRPSTAAMLPGLLAELRAKGYTVAHIVYKPGARPPELTRASKTWSAETERIIAHLRRPIVPGSHHDPEDGGGAPGEVGGPPPDAPL